jgi:hypothetical protein
MSQYRNYLNLIEVADDQGQNKIELEDLMAIHPSFTLESAELWCMFLNVRPDLSEQEVSDIKEIIERIKHNCTVKFSSMLKDMKQRQAERPAEIGENEVKITPLEIDQSVPQEA